MEAGARCVTLNFGRWDFHSKIYDEKSGVNGHAPIFDQGLSALIEDLHDRGLSDDVAVIAGASSVARRRSTATPAAIIG